MISLVIVKRKRDAIGAICRDCGAVFDVTSCPYWHWSKSMAMHSQSGHVVRYFALERNPSPEAVDAFVKALTA